MRKQAAVYTTHKPRRLKPRPQRPRRMSTREFRGKAEALVEQMIGLLDRHDGDPDLEPSPGHAGATISPNDQSGWGESGSSDREGDEHDGREPSEDPEPSLGWSAQASAKNQSRIPTEQAWQVLGADREASLGSLDSEINQNLWSAGLNDDREEQHDGREPDGDDETGADDLDAAGRPVAL